MLASAYVAPFTEKVPEVEESDEVIPMDAQTEEFVVVYRSHTERPVHKLSVQLIDTYKNINKAYYEAKALRQKETSNRGGVYNDGYDDQHYDYIISGDEIFADRYVLKHRIGKVRLFTLSFSSPIVSSFFNK